MPDYLFTTKRTGFRPWMDRDLEPFYRLNSNPEVMQYFPSILNKSQSQELIERMQLHYNQHGFCYFAVDYLSTKTFMGMVGMAYQEFKSPFTPSVDIGWRLLPEFWGKGLALEASRKCLNMASSWNLKSVNAFAPVVNKPSIALMKKLEMQFLGTFEHPKLLDYPELSTCVAYGITL